nr:immunoglobulin heavy chain junction region [Mus musculus]
CARSGIYYDYHYYAMDYW